MFLHLLLHVTAQVNTKRFHAYTIARTRM